MHASQVIISVACGADDTDAERQPARVDGATWRFSRRGAITSVAFVFYVANFGS
jgi:hypothetical protein